MTSKADRQFLERAIELALESEAEGNLPVGAVITLDEQIIGEGKSTVLKPTYHPGRHAEVNALRSVDDALWERAGEMTCYSTLEPCVMCAGTLLLHGIGRVVFGAVDRLGGAECILDELPPYYDDGGVYDWEGPVMPERCDPLYERADEIFENLPVGRKSWGDDEPDTPEELIEKLDRWLDDNPDGLRLTEARKLVSSLADRLDDDRREEVLPYAAAVFERGGYLKDFRALERYARRAGAGDPFDEVESTVRRRLPDVWIGRAIDRGEIDDAVDCWFEHEDHHRARLCADELAEICGTDRIQVLISCRLSKVEYFIGRRTRRYYRRACTVLRRLRDELESARELDYWQVIIEDVQTRWGKRPALLDELQKAGFIDG